MSKQYIRVAAEFTKEGAVNPILIMVGGQILHSRPHSRSAACRLPEGRRDRVAVYLPNSGKRTVSVL